MYTTVVRMAMAVHGKVSLKYLTMRLYKQAIANSELIQIPEDLQDCLFEGSE